MVAEGNAAEQVFYGREGEQAMSGLGALVVLLSMQAPDASVLEEVQRSHIETNVPPPAEFAPLLRQNLEAYFNAARSKAVRVEHELLRDGPTQSGVAYPKFYVWMSVFEGGTMVRQGAARVAAIERKRFDVTSFAAEKAIRADPSSIYSVFPAPVCDRIKARLGLLP